MFSCFSTQEDNRGAIFTLSPLNSNRDFREIFPESLLHLAIGFSLHNYGYKKMKSHFSCFWTAETAHRKWVLPTLSPQISGNMARRTK